MFYSLWMMSPYIYSRYFRAGLIQSVFLGVSETKKNMDMCVEELRLVWDAEEVRANTKFKIEIAFIFLLNERL